MKGEEGLEIVAGALEPMMVINGRLCAVLP